MPYLVANSLWVHLNLRWVLAFVIMVVSAIFLFALATAGTYLDIKLNKPTAVTTAVEQIVSMPLFSADNPIRRVPSKATLWELALATIIAKWTLVICTAIIVAIPGSEVLHAVIGKWLAKKVGVNADLLRWYYRDAKAMVWLWPGSTLVVSNLYVVMEQMGIGKIGATDTPQRTVALVLAYKSVVGYNKLPIELKEYLKSYPLITLAYLVLVRVECR